VLASVTRPVKELKAFRRVALEEGEETEIAFELDAELLAFVGRDLRWVVEPGAYEIHVGASSQDLRLSARFELTGPTRILPARRTFLARHLAPGPIPL
jgi:hypothetical protein